MSEQTQQQEVTKKPTTGIGAKGPAQMQPKMSASKAAKSALQRLDSVETQLMSLTFGVQQGFGQVQRDVSAHTEFIEALVDLVGRETVETRMRENRIERATKQMEEMKQKLEDAVEKSIMIPCGVVRPNALVVGTHRDAEGEIIPPGRVQIAFSEFGPDIKPLFEGKEIGAKLDLPDKTAFEITELYEPNPNPPKAGPSTEEVAAIAAEMEKLATDAAIAPEAAATQPAPTEQQ